MPRLARRIDFGLELRAISFVCKCSHVKSSKRFLLAIGRKILLLLCCVGIKSDQPLKWKEKLWQSDAIMPLKLVWLTFIWISPNVLRRAVLLSAVESLALANTCDPDFTYMRCVRVFSFRLRISTLDILEEIEFVQYKQGWKATSKWKIAVCYTKHVIL